MSDEMWVDGVPIRNPDGIRVVGVPGWTREQVLDRLIVARYEYELRRRPVRPKSRRRVAVDTTKGKR